MEGLGARIRSERKARKLGLQAVAERTGLSPSFLSQVERSIAAPSLSSLALIAQAIGVDVRTIMPPTVPAAVSRPGTRVPFGPDTSRIAYERLSTALGGALHAVKLRAAPGYRSEVSAHDGEEFVFVLSGSIRYVVGGTSHDLHPGDALHFSSRDPHHVDNVSGQVAEYLSVGTLDVFGSARTPAQAEPAPAAATDDADSAYPRRAVSHRGRRA